MSDKVTSAITSMTEEEDSVDWESDTTDSATSAPTGNTTDDKLVPVLDNISISTSSPKKVSQPCRDVDLSKKNKSVGQMRPPAVPRFPYGTNPLPLNTCRNNNTTDSVSRSAKGCNRTNVRTDKRMRPDAKSGKSSKRHKESFFKSTIPQERDSKMPSGNRPFHPDMTSNSWYQARCFDSYWRNYYFAMDWYRQHLTTVDSLSHTGGDVWQSQTGGDVWQSQTGGDVWQSQTGGDVWQSQTGGDVWQGQQSEVSSVVSQGRNRKTGSTRSSRKRRASKRARNRRLTKERQRSLSLQKASVSVPSSPESSDNEMEMEITDEMLEFFKTSLKHKMERDNQKKSEDQTEEESHVNIEDVVAGYEAPSVNAPQEQPGARRTSELKILYGSNAPMIQGMETALQLNFDRFTDKCQPSLWPNMPLKLCFG